MPGANDYWRGVMFCFSSNAEELAFVNNVFAVSHILPVGG